MLSLAAVGRQSKMVSGTLAYLAERSVESEEEGVEDRSFTPEWDGRISQQMSGEL